MLFAQLDLLFYDQYLNHLLHELKQMAHAASSKEMVAKASDQAVWLVEGFVPGPKSVGVIEAVKMGAKPYPMLPQMGLMHGALGSEIVEFLQGNESAEQALKDVEAAYMTKAKEQGFLNGIYHFVKRFGEFAYFIFSLHSSSFTVVP